MKILHLAAANRWTGAAAPAFAEVEALRAAGIDAHYAYVGGYKLQEKLAHHEFAHPLILRAQNPLAFFETVNNLERITRRHGFDVVHAHLTYDHWLARFLAREHPMAIARTFHSARTLRSDFFTRSLVRRSGGLFVVNDALKSAGVLAEREVIVTPPPLDERLFSPRGDDVRARYGIDAATPLVAIIGKVSPGRGFEEALQTFAEIRRSRTTARLMIIGHGPHRGTLEALARQLQIDSAVIWAGYHEDDLPAHYRAANVLLFTAPGSEEGHRAVIEAMGCGVPPATYPIRGMAGLLGPLSSRLMASEPRPEALAAVATDVLAGQGELQISILQQARMYSFEQSARRLTAAYARVMQRTFL